jgi:hypothetical protein
MSFVLSSFTTVPIGKHSKLKRKSITDFEASAKRTFSFFVSIRSFRDTLVVEDEEEEAILIELKCNMRGRERLFISFI